ncbi:MAG: DUF3417 domain-containing protein, partial [Saprospiraceae bacterium]
MIGNLTQQGARLKRIYIEPKLPVELEPLTDLAYNLWWSWQHEAIEMFRSIDPEKFVSVNYNPVALLDELSIEKAHALIQDKVFIERMNRVYANFQAYMKEKP